MLCGAEQVAENLEERNQVKALNEKRDLLVAACSTVPYDMGRHLGDSLRNHTVT